MQDNKAWPKADRGEARYAGAALYNLLIDRTSDDNVIAVTGSHLVVGERSQPFVELAHQLHDRIAFARAERAENDFNELLT